MYKIIDFIKEIKSFFVVNNKLYYLNNGEFLILNNEILFKSYGIEKKLDTLFCYQNLDNVNTIILTSNGEIIETLYSLDSHSFNGINTIIHNKDYSLTNQQIGLYDIKTNSIKWFDNILPFGLNIRNFDSLYYRLSKTKLSSLSLLTGLYLWELDLGFSYPTAQIHQIIGVYKNVLLVSLNEGTLLGLDTEKGVILWEMPYQAALKVRFNRGIHLDTEKGLLYCLSGNGFAVIALVNQQVIRSKNDYYVYTEEITEPYQYGYSDAGSAFGLSCWQGDYLYFTASKGTAFDCWLGVFHIPTMEVVWEYQIQNGETFNSPPQVAENKLYALDSGGTLHIFEKENE